MAKGRRSSARDNNIAEELLLSGGLQALDMTQLSAQVVPPVVVSPPPLPLRQPMTNRQRLPSKPNKPSPRSSPKPSPRTSPSVSPRGTPVPTPGGSPTASPLPPRKKLPPVPPASILPPPMPPRIPKPYAGNSSLINRGPIPQRVQSEPLDISVPKHPQKSRSRSDSDPDVPLIKSERKKSEPAVWGSSNMSTRNVLSVHQEESLSIQSIDTTNDSHRDLESNPLLPMRSKERLKIDTTPTLTSTEELSESKATVRDDYPKARPSLNRRSMSDDILGSNIDLQNTKQSPLPNYRSSSMSTKTRVKFEEDPPQPPPRQTCKSISMQLGNNIVNGSVENKAYEPLYRNESQGNVSDTAQCSEMIETDLDYDVVPALFQEKKDIETSMRKSSLTRQPASKPIFEHPPRRMKSLSQKDNSIDISHGSSTSSIDSQTQSDDVILPRASRDGASSTSSLSDCEDESHYQYPRPMVPQKNKAAVPISDYEDPISIHDSSSFTHNPLSPETAVIRYYNTTPVLHSEIGFEEKGSKNCPPLTNDKKEMKKNEEDVYYAWPQTVCGLSEVVPEATDFYSNAATANYDEPVSVIPSSSPNSFHGENKFAQYAGREGKFDRSEGISGQNYDPFDGDTFFSSQRGSQISPNIKDNSHITLNIATTESKGIGEASGEAASNSDTSLSSTIDPVTGLVLVAGPGRFFDTKQGNSIQDKPVEFYKEDFSILMSQGYQPDAIKKALLIANNNFSIARGILKEFTPKSMHDSQQ